MGTRTLTLTLPSEIVDELDARVAAGLAPTIEGGIVDAVVRTRDDGLTGWIETEAAARLDGILGGEPTLTIEALRAGIERRRLARSSKGP